MAHNSLDAAVDTALQHYRAGKWRAPLFAELILNDLSRLAGEQGNVLDIGCGNGFDGSERLQALIAGKCRRLDGIEPDDSIQPPPFFHSVQRCYFEKSSFAAGAFDVAYAAFVLEHLKEPAAFFAKVADVLRPGGVFWGFTIDRRHYFAWASALMGGLRIKNAYLDFLKGAGERYQNYPTYYRCNTPRAIARYCAEYLESRTWNWNKCGQMDAYVPRALRCFSRTADKLEMALGLPGSLLLVRAVRK